MFLPESAHRPRRPGAAARARRPVLSGAFRDGMKAEKLKGKK